MKTYIGKKEVKAQPMTKGDAFYANLLRQNTLAEAEKNEPGYLVEYADGYQSWSPANVFEAAYKVADTALDRVNIEADDFCTVPASSASSSSIRMMAKTSSR